MNYDVIDYGGNLYHTGNLKPSVKACKVKRWPVQQFNRSTIEGLIKDPSRVKAADMFGPEWIYNQGSIGSCFPPGTLIRMGDGSQRPIEEVRTTEKVLTAEGRVRTVLATMARPHVENVIRVCIWGNRHIRCTPEHPFLTKSGYKAAENLTKDDWVMIPKFAPETVDIIEPFDIIPKRVGVKKQKFLQAAGKTTYQIPGKSASTMHRVPLPELIELDSDFGWLIGIFLAEGSLNNSKITFSFHAKEVDTLGQKTCDILFRRFGIEATKVVRNNRCDVKLYGANWCQLLNELCSNGSFKKRLHPLLASGNKEFLEGVLNGWQDGDGLGDPQRCGGVTVSHELAMNMYDIANAIGHRPTIETLQVKINPKHNIKRRRLRYIVAWPKNRKPQISERSDQDDTHVWRKVAKLETEPYQGWVHNLEVADDHSYVAEGVGVHNCNGCAGAKALQRQRFLAGQPNVELSGEYLYSRINGSRDVGSMLDDGMEWLRDNGVAPWKPQHAQKFRERDFSAEDMRDSTRFKGVECYGVDSELELATGIALGFTAVVAVHATNNFMRLDANGIAGGGNGPGNHAVGVDDVKIINGELVFRMFNSWGKSYGDNGYAGLTWRRHFKTTNQYHYFYLIRSVNDDTQDNVPELKQ